jgi:hypothetical protein
MTPALSEKAAKRGAAVVLPYGLGAFPKSEIRNPKSEIRNPKFGAGVLP